MSAELPFPHQLRRKARSARLACRHLSSAPEAGRASHRADRPTPDRRVCCGHQHAAGRPTRTGASVGHRPSPPSSFPKVLELPNGWQPEGITRGRGTTIFAGSLANGAIWRVNARTGEGELFAEGAPGRVTVGLDYDRRRDVLWAAGGPTQAVYAFDGRSGELLRTYSVPNTGFLNDIVVTRNGAYVTDSNVQQLIVIPFEKGRHLPPTDAAERRPITGDFVYGPGFNANGIDALPSGRALIVVQSSTGYLFRVDPETASTARIPGVEVTFGDGIELRGRTLYVVRNQLNRIEVVRLDRQWTQALSLGAITDPKRLDVPTTATIVAGGLYVVNAPIRDAANTGNDVHHRPITASSHGPGARAALVRP